MFRRTFNAFMVSSAILAVSAGLAAAEETLKIGASAPKTGPSTGGATAVYWPNVQLWVHDVNARGGVKVGDKTLKVELVEYDDKSSPEEAVKNIQRLATVDKVDFIVAPYTTGINLATAPLLARYGFPQIIASGAANDIESFVKRWPNMFWMLGSATDLATGVVDTLKSMKEAGKIGNKVALVYIAEAAGQELVASGKPALTKAGFEIVYETSYPFATQDLSPVIAGAKAASPDAFIAYSYPPDSFGLTEQAQIQGFNPSVYFVGIGGALAGYGARFAEQSEGIMIMGGINPDDPKFKEYQKRHKEVTGKDSDYWANPVMYASFEVLEQAIGIAGSKDREKVVAAIKTGTFDTVVGSISFVNNVSPKVWTVGQWRDGVARGVNGKNVEGAIGPVLKPAWK